MEKPAQTNAQLLLELHRSGCSPDDLRRARDAITLGMQIFAGIYVGSGKPTLVHEIGSASLAHRHGARIDVVLASLLHGAYIVGEWGEYRRGVTRTKRAEVRRVVGAQAEEIVYGVWQLRWDVTSLTAFAAAAGSLNQVERGVVLVKLFELLDQLLDFGTIIGFRNVERAKSELREQRDHLCRLATGLGHPRLAAEIEQAVDVTLTTEIPPDLLGLTFPSDTPPLVIPRSCRRRPLLRIYRSASRAAAEISYAARRQLRRMLMGTGD